MNKQDLVGAVAKRLDLTRARATEITDLFFAPDGVIATELKRGGKVAISGFGTFEIRKRVAREGRNPRTGKAITGSPFQRIGIRALAGSNARPVSQVLEEERCGATRGPVPENSPRSPI